MNKAPQKHVFSDQTKEKNSINETHFFFNLEVVITGIPKVHFFYSVERASLLTLASLFI